MALRRKGFALQAQHDEPEAHQPDSGDSWLAALSYLPVFGLISYFLIHDRDYVAFHARQGLVLLVVEVAGVLAILVVDGTLGRIPFLGVLIAFLMRLSFSLPILALAVLGFAKALTGERTPLPWIGEWGEKVPPAPRWGHDNG